MRRRLVIIVIEGMEQTQRKALGAFYTAPAVVEFLIDWALPEPGATAMDPSCGDGRFLAEALRGNAATVIGVDLNGEAIAATGLELAASGKDSHQLLSADFFTVDPGTYSEVDAVVGNPPFVRYQKFAEASRKLALESALRLGVRLKKLTSTWAPFLLHATQFLRKDGRMAMVVPAEITQTQYGLPTLRALAANFNSVTLVTFERNIFEEAQTDTYLLLAEGYGGSGKSVNLIPLRDAAALPKLKQTEPDPQAFVLGDGERFIEAFLTPAERRAWQRVKKAADVFTLRELGSVTNGYVSGDNNFFHRSIRDGLPRDWLIPTARNGRSLPGLYYTAEDITDHEHADKPHHLVAPQDDLFAERGRLDAFIAEGQEAGVDQRFKCRTRRPWWKVPGLIRPDLFMTYMVGAMPRVAVNAAEAVYSNTLHGIRLNPGIAAPDVALAFHSSLTLLSTEIEGRSYGGGILKLEPTEAAAVRIALPVNMGTKAGGQAEEVNTALREGNNESANRMVDCFVLRECMGLSRYTVDLLRSGRKRLLERRSNRTKK